MSEHTSWPGDVLTSLPHPIYRVLFLDPNGRVVRVKPLEASNDDEAIRLAKGYMDGLALDLWDGLRFIENFPILEEADEA